MQIGFVRLPRRTSSAIPTTVLHGTVSASTRMHLPIASWFGQISFAIASPTTTTRGASARSSALMPRPRRIRVPIVCEELGRRPDCSVKSPSLFTESIPATNRSTSHVDQNGTVSARVARSTSGIAARARDEPGASRAAAPSRASRRDRRASTHSTLVDVVAETNVPHVEETAHEQPGADEEQRPTARPAR